MNRRLLLVLFLFLIKTFSTNCQERGELFHIPDELVYKAKYKNYIVYTFGVNRIYTVVVIASSDLYELYFTNEHNQPHSILYVKNQPDLKWAFEELPKYSEHIHPKVDQAYKYPIAYKELIYFNSQNKPIFKFNEFDETEVEELDERLRNLRDYLISLWIDAIANTQKN